MSLLAFSDLFEVDTSGEVFIMNLSEEFLESLKSANESPTTSKYRVGELNCNLGSNIKIDLSSLFMKRRVFPVTRSF